MSDTPAPTPAQQPPSPTESLLSPQFIISLCGMGIVAGVVAYTLWTGDAGDRKLVLGMASSVIASILGYWIGSSLSSQRKDEKTP